MIFLVAFCIASVVLRWQSALLNTEALLALVGVGALSLLIGCRRPHSIQQQIAFLVAGLLIGTGYSQWFAQRALSERLPVHLEKVDSTMQLDVTSMVVPKGRSDQFTATVLATASPEIEVLIGKKILLNNYKRSNRTEQVIHPCDQLVANVRIKAPRGLANNAGFDYEAYLLQKGIRAKGYIRSIDRVTPHSGFCINAFRQSFARYVAEQYPTQAGWILALTIGERAWLSKDQRDLLQQTGTMHLFVISGLHIGLAAAFMYALVLGIRKLGAGYWWKGDWRPYASLIAFCFAFLYAALAGFSIPVQRALIGLAIFFSTGFIGLHWGIWRRYWLAMAVVLLFDPLASLNTGFILSFSAVFFLMLVVSSMQKKERDESSGVKQYLGRFTQLQGILFIGLAPLSFIWFQGISWISPLVNFVAIPLLSFLIVPLCLAGFFSWLVFDSAFFFLPAASVCLAYFFYALQWLVDVLPAHPFLKPVVTLSYILLIVALGLCCFLPNVIRQRRLAFGVIAPVLFLPLFFNDNNKVPEALEMDVLDVGQGLAVLIRVGDKTLLYDTGAAWDSSSMAEMVVLPVLFDEQISAIDTLVISHADNDHAGGLPDILDALEVRTLYLSDPKGIQNKLPENTDFRLCDDGESWQWQGATFQFLTIDTDPELAGSKNNASCILAITYNQTRILMPGDIERDSERRLLQSDAGPHDLTANILLVPHHGSKSSSSKAFIEAVKPEIAIISSGFANRYRHPHEKVVERYLAKGSELLNTATVGRIRILIDADNAIQLETARQHDRKFWH